MKPSEWWEPLLLSLSLHIDIFLLDIIMNCCDMHMQAASLLQRKETKMYVHRHKYKSYGSCLCSVCSLTKLHHNSLVTSKCPSYKKKKKKKKEKPLSLAKIWPLFKLFVYIIITKPQNSWISYNSKCNQNWISLQMCFYLISFRTKVHKIREK